ncbi:hypothetical protein AEQU1_00387 [Aequorivita sp. CIP111184]|nr:hypothetical protein AEQU1_00387 [Aequorivita sp. CIP111184]
MNTNVSLSLSKTLYAELRQAQRDKHCLIINNNSKSHSELVEDGLLKSGRPYSV